MRRFLLALALLLFAAAPALAVPRSSAPPIVASLVGVPEVGHTLYVVGAPASATCSIKSNGVQVSTSCVSYDLVSGDGGHTMTLTVTTPSQTAYAALTIGGTPATTANAGSAYSFTPSSSGGSGGNVFAVASMPTWASFSTSTGALTGTPSGAEVDAGITISVADSLGISASLAPFTITVTSGPPPGSLDFSTSEGTGLGLALGVI